MDRSSTSNKRSHDLMTPGDDDHDDDGGGCPQTKRFKTKNANEPWPSQDALQLLSKMNKHHAKEELLEEEMSRRNALRASIHKDIGHVQEMIADMDKTAGSQRNELMMSIHQVIHLVKQKIANLEKMVLSGGKLEADASQPAMDAFQQVLGMMTSVNICEYPINQPFNYTMNERKKVEKTVVSRRTTMTASNLTPSRRRVASGKRASDYVGGNCPKATLQITMDLEIPQIKAPKDLSLPQSKVGLVTPKSKVTLELSRAKPWRKATGATDLFTRRARRFKAMREALNEASMRKRSKTQYAAIWKELDDTWLKMMAHETIKSFAKRKGKTISDDPMRAIDAHLDELESWISSEL